MRERLTALLDELQRLKREGVTVLPVSEEALAQLRAATSHEVAQASDPVAAPAAQAPRVQPELAAKRGEPARTIATEETPPAYAGSSGKAAASAFAEIMAAAEKRSTPAFAAPAAPARPASSSKPAESASGIPEAPTFTLPEGTKRERWDWLRDRVLNCPVCRAHTHGDNKVVFGVGSIDADIFFCGEAPGGEEEIQGEPFVGPAGQLLNKMIGAMGLKREQVYIGNILNWRPEMEGRLNGTSVRQVGNRPPTTDEMRFGLPYLRAQVEVVSPKVIVALGSTAAEGLLGFGSFKSLGSVRGRWHEFNGTPLMVTYHPSYLLRNASNRTKRVVWEDLLQVMEKVGLAISEKQRGYFL